ncbi:hypothetical protein B0H17DRAFT_117145 [Mycena rosella]|uniref:Uncharacterized protein n=1 Tax=Mycena rosella TaxID=1033263 RepID=A0AAD7D7D5_MYCRO|nr:hypothetical protein B0H17DRAFT_117145 [Mycena rosella]
MERRSLKCRCWERDSTRVAAHRLLATELDAQLSRGLAKISKKVARDDQGQHAGALVIMMRMGCHIIRRTMLEPYLGASDALGDPSTECREFLSPRKARARIADSGRAWQPRQRVGGATKGIRWIQELDSCDDQEGGGKIISESHQSIRYRIKRRCISHSLYTHHWFEAQFIKRRDAWTVSSWYEHIFNVAVHVNFRAHVYPPSRCSQLERPAMSRAGNNGIPVKGGSRRCEVRGGLVHCETHVGRLFVSTRVKEVNDDAGGHLRAEE